MIVFIAGFVLTVCYLISVRALMKSIERTAPDYWVSLGRPDSFSANHGSAILSNLYKPDMSKACAAGCATLLRNVRVLLPLSAAVNATALVILGSGR